jgi:hypothetical protein
MQNKIVLTLDQEEWLLANYKTTTKRTMAEKFDGITPQSVSRVLLRYGLVRTSEERRALVLANLDAMRSVGIDISVKLRRKIEGGGRNAPVQNMHLQRWIKTNGNFSIKRILVYANAQYDNFNDLKLIDKCGYDTYIVKRKERLRIKSRKDEAVKRNAINNARAEKRRKANELFEKNSAIIKQTAAKSEAEATQQLKEDDRVPVKLDDKTTIWPKRSKCTQLPDGTWVKNTPLDTDHKPDTRGFGSN